jgi:hypothetical protein
MYFLYILKCNNSVFQYISNKMQRYTVYLYLETGLHVASGTSTHHQERIQLYLQHLVFVTITTTCRYRGRAETLPVGTDLQLELHSNSSTIATGSSNGVTNTTCYRYNCMRS